MPSETGVARESAAPSTPLELSAVLERLRPALDPFRSAVAEAAEEVRLYRARHEELTADPVGRVTKELGPFAVGRIDPLRLSALLGASGPGDPLTDRLMAVAHERFAAADSGGMGSYRVVVPDGADLRDVVKDALAEVGRAFGTAHAVEKARHRLYDPDRDHALLHPHPFHRWTPAERALAPPLIVEVSGAGLRGAALLEFMEGRQKLVLSVRGDSPPAPLARLASPGVFVAQTGADGGLDAVSRLARHDGPGVVAIFEQGSGALLFSYAPGGEVELDEAPLEAAMELADATEGKPGILDLRYLAGLVAAAALQPSATPVPSTAAEAVAAPGDVAPSGSVPPPAAPPAPPASHEATVDQLADWLLARTEPSEG